MKFRILLLCFLAASLLLLSTDAASSSRRRVKRSLDPKELTLVFVSAMWRHGDRAPTEPFPGDKVNETFWTQGGGGYGQLSTRGMSQHVKLGSMLRDMYITKVNLLSKSYRSNEVFVRSTDVNRTIISAMSNMIGMFSQPENGNKPGLDYPDIATWPKNFVPIAIHTVDETTDYVGNTDADCKRQTELWEIAKKSPEFVNYINKPLVKKTLDLLSKSLNTTIDSDNLYKIADGMYIEKLYRNDTSTLYPWYPRVADNIDLINDAVENFQNGLISYQYNGLDIGKEIKKIRGGSLIRLVNDYINMKIDCLDEKKECKPKFKDLKYFVISAHDTTLAAYLSTLEAKDFVPKAGGYPHYAAAILTELYKHKNGSYFLKFLYHRGAGEDGAGDLGADNIDVLTAKVAGCPIDDDFCPRAALADQAAKYDPGNAAELCKTSPGNEPSPTSSPAPTQPTQAPPNTDKPPGPPVTNPPPDTTTESGANLSGFFGTLLVALVTFFTITA